MGITLYKFNKTAKEVSDAYLSNTKVFIRKTNIDGDLETSLMTAKVSQHDGTDSNGNNFHGYIFDFGDDEGQQYYAFGDNYYPVNSLDTAAQDAGLVLS